MGRIGRAALFAVTWGLLAPAALAQTLKVPEKISRRDTVTIEYSDPWRAGETILVEIDDGAFPDAHVIEISITLDAKGMGSARWKVLDWESASFNAPGVHEITRGIY